MTYLRAARTFIEACDAEGIPVLPVKGIVSAYTLYDDPAERMLTDVDVRVAPRDVARVARLASRKGWPIVQRLHSYVNVVAAIDHVCIDVEGHVGPPGMCRLQVTDMIQRATHSREHGFDCLVPDFHDHAVVLVVNVFKDKLLKSFSWSVRDLERVVLHPLFDADALVARLREAKCTTIGWVVADWMSRSHGSRAWEMMRDRLQPGRQLYLSALRRASDRDVDGLLATLLTRLGPDKPLDRARSVLRVAWFGAETGLDW